MLQISVSRAMKKMKGNLFFKYTFQVRETLSPMFALRQKYLEYFLRWYLKMELFRIFGIMGGGARGFKILYYFVGQKYEVFDGKHPLSMPGVRYFGNPNWDLVYYRHS